MSAEPVIDDATSEPTTTTATSTPNPTRDSTVTPDSTVTVTEAADTTIPAPITAGDQGVATRSADVVGDGDRPEGFGTVTVRITAADGSVCDVCLWHADGTPLQRRGLMGVTDLGEPVGMAFAYDSPSTGNFVMISTPTPLSIAWFAPSGGFLSATDMTPCTEADSDDCERYNTSGPYTLAIEMFQRPGGGSQLDLVGIGPGSTADIVAVHPSSSSCDLAL